MASSNACVRLAVVDDVSALPDVERSAAESFRVLPDLSWIADGGVTPTEDHVRSIDGRGLWVAEDESCVVGFLSAERKGGDFHIVEVSVRRDRQGRGHGRALIEAAISQAQREGSRAVTLTTFRDVPWNEPFYTRMGFETLGPSELDERLVELLMREVERGLPEGRRVAMRLRVKDEDERHLHARALAAPEGSAALDLWITLAARGNPDAPDRLRAYARCDAPELHNPALAALAEMELSHDDPMP